MTLRTDAEELAAALELGLISIRDAIRWADAAVEVEVQPPLPLVEVSLAAKAPPA